MNMKKTFTIGGVHPDENKLTATKPICELGLPKQAVYPLSQHIGAPATPIVAVGDAVKKGQKIAEAGGFVSAPIHASVSGTVKAIEPRRVAVGDMVNSIIIENDGLYNEVEYEVVEDVTTLSKESIINKVKEAGIVGLGGAAFPTWAKFNEATNPDYKDTVSLVLMPIREKEFTRTILESAAIIAYKQPVTRIDLEEIRGNSEYAVQKLLELGMIEPVGRKDAVGKPVLFGTTDKFLKRFQISSLDELPDYEELINKISLIHGNKQDDDYLYTKDVYIEETAVTEINKDTKKIVDERNIDADDFNLPDINYEELPDFLVGEDVEKY